VCDRGNPCAGAKESAPAGRAGREAGHRGKQAGGPCDAAAEPRLTGMAIGGPRQVKVIQMAVMRELQAHDVERPGERLQLHLDMNRAVLIDPQTELVL
jgi:hypothetical protein